MDGGRRQDKRRRQERRAASSGRGHNTERIKELGEVWDVNKCSYSRGLKVVLATVPTASKLLIKFSINVLTHVMEGEGF